MKPKPHMYWYVRNLIGDESADLPDEIFYACDGPIALIIEAQEDAYHIIANGGKWDV